MKQRLIERRDGTYVVEIIGSPDDCGYYDDLAFYDPDTGGRGCKVGDEGCLGVSGYVGPNGDPGETATLYSYPEGIAGNFDASVKRLHGWRGTTNGLACYACGWRRVTAINLRKRGIGIRVILSADLRPDEA